MSWTTDIYDDLLDAQSGAQEPCSDGHQQDSDQGSNGQYRFVHRRLHRRDAPGQRRLRLGQLQLECKDVLANDQLISGDNCLWRTTRFSLRKTPFRLPTSCTQMAALWNTSRAWYRRRSRRPTSRCILDLDQCSTHPSGRETAHPRAAPAWPRVPAVDPCSTPPESPQRRRAGSYTPRDPEHHAKGCISGH